MEVCLSGKKENLFPKINYQNLLM